MSKEFEIIEQVFRRRVRARRDVSLGIGDDAALTRLPEGCDLVTATDALVAGTHFLVDAPAHSVGHRCLAGAVGWGSFEWGGTPWGEILLPDVKTKLLSKKLRSQQLEFTNSTAKENVLISGYELEVNAPYKGFIKE